MDTQEHLQESIERHRRLLAMSNEELQECLDSTADCFGAKQAAEWREEISARLIQDEARLADWESRPFAVIA